MQQCDLLCPITQRRKAAVCPRKARRPSRGIKGQYTRFKDGHVGGGFLHGTEVALLRDQKVDHEGGEMASAWTAFAEDAKDLIAPAESAILCEARYEEEIEEVGEWCTDVGGVVVGCDSLDEESASEGESTA